MPPSTNFKKGHLGNVHGKFIRPALFPVRRFYILDVCVNFKNNGLVLIQWKLGEKNCRFRTIWKKKLLLISQRLENRLLNLSFYKCIGSNKILRGTLGHFAPGRDALYKQGPFFPTRNQGPWILKHWFFFAKLFTNKPNEHRNGFVPKMVPNIIRFHSAEPVFYANFKNTSVLDLGSDEWFVNSIS